MEQETNSHHTAQIQNVFDPELQPLYKLTEPQYNSVINRLVNVIHYTVSTLHLSGNTDAAQQIAERGYEVLRDYDDDVAEAVRWHTQPRRIAPSRLGQPRDVAPKLPEPTIDLPFI